LDLCFQHFRVLENALSSAFKATTHSTHSTTLLSLIELSLTKSKNAVHFTSDN
jgi:hypothetical protein